MSPVPLAFEGRMSRQELAALLDSTGASSPISPRPLLGAASLAVPRVSAAFAEAARVIAAPRTNLTLRLWSGEEASVETNFLFRGLPGGGHGVALNPLEQEYQIAGYIDPEAIVAILAPVLPPPREQVVPAFEAQLDRVTMAVFAACLDVICRDVLSARVARAIDKSDMPPSFLEAVPPLALEHVQAYLERMWGWSRFDQLITYVLPLSVMQVPPPAARIAEAMDRLATLGFLHRVRPGRFRATAEIEPVVTALLGASAGFQWQRITQMPGDAILVVERTFLMGAEGVALEFRLASDDVLRMSACGRADIVDFIADELAVATVPPPPSEPEAAPKFCGQCGATLQPDWKFCGACGAEIRGGGP